MNGKLMLNDDVLSRRTSPSAFRLFDHDETPTIPAA
jgi:hypothetical protein